LAVRGDGIDTPFGRVVHAREAGKALTALKPLKHGKPGPAGKHGPKHGPKPGPKHGPKHKPPHKPKHDRADDAHA
jgi:hypothetical protein